MIAGSLYSREDNKFREVLKTIFRKLPFRGEVAFIHSYIYKLGFLDGRVGFVFARSRHAYYRVVTRSLKPNKVLEINSAENKQMFVSEK